MKGDPQRSRLGINLAGPADWSTELPFVDVFRLSREWISQRDGAGWGMGPKLDRDPDGWIRRLEPGCYAETPLCTIEGGHYPKGRYVCLYEGDGQIEFSGAAVGVASRRPGRIEFDVDPARGGFFLQLRRTNPSDYLRRLRVLLPGFERTYRADPFHPAFLQRWRGMNALRFMDWQLTNGSALARWRDRPTAAFCNATERGVPVETMVDLSNRLGADPWFCIPHQADDAFVRQFAAAVRGRLHPDRKVYVEYSNELWNGGFAQTRWCEQEGLARKLHEKPWEAGWRYASQRSVEIFQLFTEVLGPGRLVRVMATQAANPFIGEVKLSFGEASRHCDALAIAPYFGYLVGAAKAPAVARGGVPGVLDYLERKALPEAVGWMQAHRTLARRFGKRLLCYEAGQHAVGVGGGENDDALTRVLTAANRHPRMGALYTRYLDAWRDAGGGDLCCLFSSVGAWSKWGSWGLLEFADDDTPKFRAARAWNAANPKKG